MYNLVRGLNHGECRTRPHLMRGSKWSQSDIATFATREQAAFHRKWDQRELKQRMKKQRMSQEQQHLLRPKKPYAKGPQTVVAPTTPKDSPLLQLCQRSGVARLNITDCTRAEEYTRRMNEQIRCFIEQHNRHVADEATAPKKAKKLKLAGLLSQHSAVPKQPLPKATRQELNPDLLPTPSLRMLFSHPLRRRFAVDPERLQYINAMHGKRINVGELKRQATPPPPPPPPSPMRNAKRLPKIIARLHRHEGKDE